MLRSSYLDCQKSQNGSKVLVKHPENVVRREKVGGAFTLIPQEAKA